MQSQNQSDYPFRPLSTPSHRPVFGLVLIWIGWGLPLLIAGIYLLLFFFYWIPAIPVGDFSYSNRLFVVMMSLGFLVLFVRPLLAKLVTRGQALRQVDAIALLAAHPSPPVLYLRSFSDDPLVDTTPTAPIIPSLPTYETRFQKVLGRLGPVICIGRPDEKVGVARFYVANDEWQTAVEYFLPRAAAVVLMMGPTKGLLWEVGAALQGTDLERLLFFFPYVFPIERSGRWWYRFTLGTNLYRSNFSFGKVQQRMVQERDTRYTFFREQVQPFLANPLPATLGQASFLTFSPDGRPQLLKTRYPPPSRLSEKSGFSKQDFVVKFGDDQKIQNAKL